MTILNIILLLVAITLSVIVVNQARLLWQEIQWQKVPLQNAPRQGTTKDEDDQSLRSQIAEEAAAAGRKKREKGLGLSASGATSIHREIDHCVATENWDEAVKWALHAIESRPDHIESKVKLAEVYCMARYRAEFAELFEELQETLDDESELGARLSMMAREIVHDRNPGDRRSARQDWDSDVRWDLH